MVKARHQDSAFTGEGARLHGGRWNSPGVPVVYASATRSLALLEVLAGVGSMRPLVHYVLIPVTFDDALIEVLSPGVLPADWRQSPPPTGTRGIGGGWVAGQTSAVLEVPSVLVPQEANYLINPVHPDAKHLVVGEPEMVAVDGR
jgi:RES domain-containing protein